MNHIYKKGDLVRIIDHPKNYIHGYKVGDVCVVITAYEDLTLNLDGYIQIVYKCCVEPYAKSERGNVF